MGSATQELERFVHDALAAGASKPQIEDALASAGWPPAQVRASLGAYADVGFQVPVPRPRAYLSAREAFLYLVLFSTLYVSAWQLGRLLFDLIEYALPDAAEAQYRAQGLGRSLRWSIASLLVAFPVFAFVAHRLGREEDSNPARRLSAVRRWLTYLTLFIATVVLVGDVTTLVYNLLGGELSLRFVLKTLVVGLIAGTIFAYYLTGLRREEQDA